MAVQIKDLCPCHKKHLLSQVLFMLLFKKLLRHFNISVGGIKYVGVQIVVACKTAGD